MDTLSPPSSSILPCRRQRSNQKIDRKSGSVFIVNRSGGLERKVKVYINVIGNYYEQHAQIYTDAKFSEQFGYFSLRNCEISLNPMDKTLVHISWPGVDYEITLRTKSLRDAEDWAEALKPKCIISSAKSIYSPTTSPQISRAVRNYMTS